MNDRLDIDTALRFVFRDPKWVQKALVGGFLYLTLIGLVPVMGWALEIQRRAIRGENEPLPEWDDFGKYIVDGLKLWLVEVVYFLPVYAFGLIYFALFLPYSINSTTPTSYDQLIYMFAAGSFACMPFLMLYSFLLWTLLPHITGIMAETGDIVQALNVPYVLRLTRARLGQTLLAGLLGYMAIYAASFIGIYLLCVGMFFLAPIGYAMMHHLFGQAYRLAKAKLGEAVLPAVESLT